MIHETYYYWLHRWMHLPHIYKYVHKAHHESLTTTAWTSFSFHPIESFLQGLPLFILSVSYTHLDMNLADKQSTEFGKGQLDILGMLQSHKRSGMKYFFIEQEEYGKEAYDSLEYDINFYKKLKW